MMVIFKYFKVSILGMHKAVMGIGIALVVIGLFSMFYTYTTVETTEGPFGYEETDTSISTPYQGFALPLVLIGSIVIVIGATIKSSSATSSSSRHTGRHT
jgi:hypothetical protein